MRCVALEGVVVQAGGGGNAHSDELCPVVVGIDPVFHRTWLSIHAVDFVIFPISLSQIPFWSKSTWICFCCFQLRPVNWRPSLPLCHVSLSSVLAHLHLILLTLALLLESWDISPQKGSGRRGWKAVPPLGGRESPAGLRQNAGRLIAASRRDTLLFPSLLP